MFGKSRDGKYRACTPAAFPLSVKCDAAGFLKKHTGCDTVSDLFIVRPSAMPAIPFLLIVGYQIQIDCPLYSHVLKNSRRDLAPSSQAPQVPLNTVPASSASLHQSPVPGRQGLPSEAERVSLFYGTGVNRREVATGKLVSRRDEHVVIVKDIRLSPGCQPDSILFLSRLFIYDLPKYRSIVTEHFGVNPIPRKLVQVVALGTSQQAAWRAIEVGSLGERAGY